MLILSATETEETDSVTGINPEWHLPNAAFLESFIPLYITGKTWSIAEQPYPSFVEKWIPLIGNHGMRSELITQHFLPPRKFLILSNKGIQFVTKMRPIDIFYNILISSGTESEALTNFFNIYGVDQTCAMCLMLICQNPETFFKVSLESAYSLYPSQDSSVASLASTALSKGLFFFFQYLQVLKPLFEIEQQSKKDFIAGFASSCRDCFGLFGENV